MKELTDNVLEILINGKRIVVTSGDFQPPDNNGEMVALLQELINSLVAPTVADDTLF